MKHFEHIADHAAPESRIYTLCFFEAQSIVPKVVLIDASDDAEALAEAGTRLGFTTREVWDRHRLVGVIEPAW